MSGFAERVHERLKELRWTQAMLATKAGMPPSMLSKLLNNNFNIETCRLQTLGRIIRALDVNEEWLISGKEPKFQLEKTTDTSYELIGTVILPRMSASIEAYAEYLEDRGYKVPPKMLADGVMKLYYASVQENTYDKTELKRILTGERKVENTGKTTESTDLISEGEEKTDILRKLTFF